VDPSIAELAVAVVDDWQGHGVGSRLSATLADRARSEGIKAFTALVLANNKLMLSLIGEIGEVHDVHSERGTIELIGDLPEHGIGQVSRLLRATARGEIDAVGHRRPSASGGAPAQRRGSESDGEHREPQHDR
jgi:hypothetical protein